MTPSVLNGPDCPDAADRLQASFDVVSGGQSVVLGTAVVLGVLAALLYRWRSRRRKKYRVGVEERAEEER